MVVTTDGRTFHSDLIDKATDQWEAAVDKAEKTHRHRATRPPVSFADVVPKEFAKRLLSSSSFPRDLVSPLTDYFSKLEMTETGCTNLSDLNLIGKIDDHSCMR